MKAKIFRFVVLVLNSDWGILNRTRERIVSFFQEKVVTPLYSKKLDLNKRYSIKNLSIESSSICNSKCVFCPHGDGSLERKKEVMSNEKFFELIEICKRDGIEKISFGGLGEFLVDKNFLEKARYVKDQGLKLSTLTTNGMLLKEEVASSLIDLEIESITVSIDSFEKNEYEKIRVGLKFDTVIRNMETLVRVNKEKGSKTHINLNVTVMNDDSIIRKTVKDRFKDYLGDSFSVSLIPLHNWGVMIQMVLREALA